MSYLDIAIELAKEAGHIQMDGLGKVHNIEYKGVTDLVTEVDKNCEKFIVSRLQKEFPDHDILAEESGGRNKKSDWRWIIDPLDGTVNYTHRYPLFAVSIALEYKGAAVLGVVFDPNKSELFAAEDGAGAILNGGRINVSETLDLQKALLGTGFAYNIHRSEKQNNIRYFTEFLTRCRAARCDGVASTDLCYVACGRLDGFWELYLRPWDIAAGQLIVKEAGGRVSSFNGSALDIYGNEILVSNGKIHEQMIKVLTV